MPDDDLVSHSDIYHKLGTLEGKVESVLLQLTEKRTDVNNLFSRIRDVENKVAWGMGAAAIISVTVPLLIAAIEPKVHFSSPTSVESVSRPDR